GLLALSAFFVVQFGSTAQAQFDLGGPSWEVAPGLFQGHSAEGTLNTYVTCNRSSFGCFIPNVEVTGSLNACEKSKSSARMYAWIACSKKYRQCVELEQQTQVTERRYGCYANVFFRGV